MKNTYKLFDNSQNRAQYSRFLEQYKKMEDLEVKSDNMVAFLDRNKYRLNVTWVNENLDVEEVVEVAKKATESKPTRGRKKKEE